MTSISQLIITVGAVAAALLTFYGIVKSIIMAVLSSRRNRQNQIRLNNSQEQAIAKLKEENQLICYGLLAALDGLEQLGANHIVPVAKSKLEKYLNQQAHK